MSAKHDRNGVAARFLILSRQRSASTTLVRLLNQHAGVTCLLELLNPGGPPLPFLSPRLILPLTTNMKEYEALHDAINVSSHADAMTDLPSLMDRFWRWCPTPICGFKVICPSASTAYS